jgi:hypothetical protein
MVRRTSNDAVVVVGGGERSHPERHDDDDGILLPLRIDRHDGVAFLPPRRRTRIADVMVRRGVSVILNLRGGSTDRRGEPEDR